jgi:hypothetical protein
LSLIQESFHQKQKRQCRFDRSRFLEPLIRGDEAGIDKPLVLFTGGI